jgi:uncharacterized membrane protein
MPDRSRGSGAFIRCVFVETPSQETPVKVFLLVVGALLVLLGLHWIGQGTAIFVWPANPTMGNRIEWAYHGGGAGIAGVFLMWSSRRHATTNA